MSPFRTLPAPAPGWRQWLASWLADPHPVSHREKLHSALGAWLGILAVLWVSSAVLDPRGAVLVVASMGATAVLLFAVPHSPLSRPWPVLGGHLVSAAIGVSCARAVSDPALAATLAVSLSVAAMYYLRCLHPPGGATALAAVLGGAPVQALGYGYLLAPVLLNVAVMLAVALLLRRLPWGRAVPTPAPVPSAVMSPPAAGAGEKCHIAHSDLVFALSQIDSFIDVSEDDLLRIYDLAVRPREGDGEGMCRA